MMTIDTAASVLRAMLALRDDARAASAQRFFKTGPGEYGEGDKFLGIPVPMVRKLSRQYRVLSLQETLTLLTSEWHEVRQLATFIMVLQFERGTEAQQKAIYTAYLKHTAWVNNWDLVDGSARQIVGSWLLHRDTTPITKLMKSKDLWERRIAVLATFQFVANGDLAFPLSVAQAMLGDTHDLIHKAIGWMLRDVGDKDRAVLERFLDTHVQAMPRTALRYAIEHMPEKQRKGYLSR